MPPYDLLLDYRRGMSTLLQVRDQPRRLLSVVGLGVDRSDPKEEVYSVGEAVMGMGNEACDLDHVGQRNPQPHLHHRGSSLCILLMPPSFPYFLSMFASIFVCLRLS